jgi:hypothetical protein
MYPAAEVVLSYKIPRTRSAGAASSWAGGNTGCRSIQLRPDDAARIPDDELRDLVRAALGG